MAPNNSFAVELHVWNPQTGISTVISSQTISTPTDASAKVTLTPWTMSGGGSAGFDLAYTTPGDGYVLAGDWFHSNLDRRLIDDQAYGIFGEGVFQGSTDDSYLPNYFYPAGDLSRIYQTDMPTRGDLTPLYFNQSLNRYVYGQTVAISLASNPDLYPFILYDVAPPTLTTVINNDGTATVTATASSSNDLVSLISSNSGTLNGKGVDESAVGSVSATVPLSGWLANDANVVSCQETDPTTYRKTSPPVSVTLPIGTPEPGFYVQARPYDSDSISGSQTVGYHISWAISNVYNVPNVTYDIQRLHHGKPRLVHHHRLGAGQYP